jgi:hypothetical protein
MNNTIEKPIRLEQNSFNNSELTHLRKLSNNEKEVFLNVDEELKSILTITIEPRFHKLYQKCE